MNSFKAIESTHNQLIAPVNDSVSVKLHEDSAGRGDSGRVVYLNHNSAGDILPGITLVCGGDNGGTALGGESAAYKKQLLPKDYNAEIKFNEPVIDQPALSKEQLKELLKSVDDVLYAYESWSVGMMKGKQYSAIVNEALNRLDFNADLHLNSGTRCGAGPIDVHYPGADNFDNVFGTKNGQGIGIIARGADNKPVWINLYDVKKHLEQLAGVTNS